MHTEGLFGRMQSKKRYNSYRGSSGKTAPNIIQRDFKANKPLKKCSTDVCEFRFNWGKCYFSPILDMYSNEILSYDLSLSANLNQITNMLEQLFSKFPNLTGLIMHSDQGWQYQHDYYVNTLKEHGIKQSMSRKGNCYDNGIIESFFSRVKNEFYDALDKSASFETVSEALSEFIDYYNNKRIQAKTKWMPPTKYRETSILLN